MIAIIQDKKITLCREDVFHFLGIRDKEARDQLEAEVDSTIKEISQVIKPMACYKKYPLSADGNKLDLGFAKLESRDLAKNLNGCSSFILIAATAGLGVDRLIAKYSRLAPSRALLLQAAGAAAVEALLDSISKDFEAEGLTLCPRFSCGYGDLPLSLQTDIFAALDCPKNIGVSLTDSLLMTPTKSVSAIIGIKDKVFI